MKKLKMLGLLLLVVGVCACKFGQSILSSRSDNADFAKWDAWKITWQHAQTFSDVTVKGEGTQKTYLPEQKSYVFLAVKAAIKNISNETQEMRFWQGPVYLSDSDQNEYDMVGLAYEDTILMAPPIYW